MIRQKFKLIVLISFFYFTQVFSQVEYVKITYNKKSTTELKKTDKKETYASKILKETREAMKSLEYTLTFNNKESFFKEVPVMSLDNGNSMSLLLSRLLGETSGSFYVDRKSGKTFHQIEFESDLYLVEFNKINDWKLTQEQKKIGSYNCYKATKNETYLNSSGDQITYEIIAWYTPELPYPYGPTKYNGLPGLILELVNRQACIYAHIIKLNPKRKEEIKKPDMGLEVTKIEYDSIVGGLAKDFRKKYKRN
jgi:GLPGLI family protein